MPARTGQHYIASLRAHPAEIWVGGERVEDVTTHPATRNAVRSYARLYDMQHEPALQDTMTYALPSGERVGMSFLMPTSVDDLARRHAMMRVWAEYSGGMMGRTPDYLNASVMAMGAAASYFGANDPRHADNIRRYYEYVRDHDLCLTHTLINPQINRSRPASGQADPYLAAGIVRETDDGLIIRGARMLATSAPLSEEIMVFPSTVLKESGDATPYAYAFAIPCNTPGLRFICRESFDLGRSHFDHPLGSRFEEMDAIVVFDDVLVPWERVFLKGDTELCNNVFSGTNAVLHMAHQVVVKNIAKAEFLLGLACLMAHTIAIEGFQHVQEKLAEMMTYVETMKAAARASEVDAHIDQYGLMCPARGPLDLARNTFPRMYPRMVEIIQQLGASGLMALPPEAALHSPIAPDVHGYLQAARADAPERIRLFRLAWDVACSSFGARQVLYERFFFGDPVRMMSALYNVYDKEPLMDRVRAFLAHDEPAAVSDQPPAIGPQPSAVSDQPSA
jgi:4-hydroxyphenylacetate 3-monooxygenase